VYHIKFPGGFCEEAGSRSRNRIQQANGGFEGYPLPHTACPYHLNSSAASNESGPLPSSRQHAKTKVAGLKSPATSCSLLVAKLPSALTILRSYSRASPQHRFRFLKSLRLFTHGWLFGADRTRCESHDVGSGRTQLQGEAITLGQAQMAQTQKWSAKRKDNSVAVHAHAHVHGAACRNLHKVQLYLFKTSLFKHTPGRFHCTRR
jgi:hypothetical protein